MKRLLLIPVLFLLPSCGALGNLAKGAEDAQRALTQNQQNAADFMGKLGDLFGQFKGTLDLLKSLDLPKIASLLSQLPQLEQDLKQAQADLKQAAPQAFAKADKNGDGKLDPSELLTYLLFGGGAAAAAIAKLLANVRARAEAGDAAQQKHLDDQWDQLAELQKQLALLQAQQAPKS